MVLAILFGRWAELRGGGRANAELIATPRLLVFFALVDALLTTRQASGPILVLLIALQALTSTGRAALGLETILVGFGAVLLSGRGASAQRCATIVLACYAILGADGVGAVRCEALQTFLSARDAARRIDAILVKLWTECGLGQGPISELRASPFLAVVLARVKTRLASIQARGPELEFLIALQAFHATSDAAVRIDAILPVH
mmetsp:Transcript_107437/g.229375  ORF Transcript_107437/g.229375 Transcript_107437/m.229375 type:complete len:203 (-) Transcript_107437:289-897(-)